MCALGANRTRRDGAQIEWTRLNVRQDNDIRATPMPVRSETLIAGIPDWDYNSPGTLFSRSDRGLGNL